MISMDVPSTAGRLFPPDIPRDTPRTALHRELAPVPLPHCVHIQQPAFVFCGPVYQPCCWLSWSSEAACGPENICICVIPKFRTPYVLKQVEASSAIAVLHSPAHMTFPTLHRRALGYGLDIASIKLSWPCI